MCYVRCLPHDSITELQSDIKNHDSFNRTVNYINSETDIEIQVSITKELIGPRKRLSSRSGICMTDIHFHKKVFISFYPTFLISFYKIILISAAFRFYIFKFFSSFFFFKKLIIELLLRYSWYLKSNLSNFCQSCWTGS